MQHTKPSSSPFLFLPQQLSLRQTEVAGRILVTTLTDARSVAPLDLDTLYRQRWQVEVDSCVR